MRGYRVVSAQGSVFQMLLQPPAQGISQIQLDAVGDQIGNHAGYHRRPEPGYAGVEGKPQAAAEVAHQQSGGHAKWFT